MSFPRNPGRYAGVLYLATSIVGAFAMIYAPGRIVMRGDAAGTAANLLAHETLFRVTIAAQLLSEAAFIFVALALFELLQGVNRRQASLMVTLIVVSIPVTFVNELNYIAALMLARGADYLSVFDKPQRDALALLFLNLRNDGLGIAGIFWGLWLFPMALLVYRSGFLPRFLGVWLALGGVANIVMSLTGILVPQYAHAVFTWSQIPNFGEIALMLWLIVRGAQPEPEPTA
jgi:hypothetical protein